MKDIKKESIELVKIRYEKMHGKYPFTISRLNKSVAFKDLFLKLKKKDYPDWVIYMAISNSIINYRVNINLKNKPNISPEAYHAMFIEHMNRPESENDTEVPESEFTEEKIEFAIEANIMSFFKGEGYVFRRATPNYKALRRLAEQKYNYFGFDAPHAKWFSFEK